MGSLMGGGPTPPPIPTPPPAASPATAANPNVAATASNARARAAAAATQSDTVGASGPQGLKQPPKTANVTLLGGS